ncbi:MAG: pyrimidine-nucleoside phosphorylase, partial [Erysipelotrichaceae bacterium]
QFKNEFEVKSKKSGWISKIEAEEVGKAAMVLGAGRETKEDVIDHSVGVLLKKKVGDYVEEGETLAIIQYNERNLQSSIKLLESAYTIIDEKVNKNNVILEIHAVNVL